MRISYIIVGLFLLFLTYFSARNGYAALLTENALAAHDVSAAQEAAKLAPGDPRAQVVAGALLEAVDSRTTAIQHYQTAVALRPDDYVLWMQLARAQELEGDSNAAINSASLAVGLAPAYAQTHWQLGNILVRAGRHDGGFSELRLAAASDPKLLPSIIDLAGQLSGGSSGYFEKLIDPKAPAAYAALFDYFKKRGLSEKAIHWLSAGGDTVREQRRAYISELIGLKKLKEAREVWEIEHPSDPDGELLPDASFEQGINLDEPGFGWRSEKVDKTITLSFDSANPKAGRSSLRVDFNGPTTGADLISRLASLEANAHYKLTFSFRADQIISGGLPYMAVVDATTDQPLAQSEILPQTTDGWRDATVEFTTAENSTVRIALQRQTCPAPQCPIFGRLWLDDFYLRRYAR